MVRRGSGVVLRAMFNQYAVVYKFQNIEDDENDLKSKSRMEYEQHSIELIGKIVKCCSPALTQEHTAWHGQDDVLRQGTQPVM